MASMIDPQSLCGDWHYPTRMHFGPGRIAELAEICLELGLRRPMLVTDDKLAAMPMIEQVLANNHARGLATGLFADVASNPTGDDIERGLAALARGEHDGIIAFGGGSALDTGKCIAFMAGQTRPLLQFVDVGDNWRRARTAGILPCIAVPTTAGTGSEVGRAAVITDRSSGAKKIIFHPSMMPRAVIGDPELTVHLPSHLTAATGMDALTHCIEALCAPGWHPMADGIALEGARLVKAWLPRAFVAPHDLAARAHMLIAASMGATAFQKGLGAVHSLSHALGAVHQVHHGLANAIALPYVLAFNQSVIADPMMRLANALQLSTSGKSAYQCLLDWVLDLRAALEIPANFSAIGIDGEQSARIARLAAQDPTARTNPRPVTEADMRELFLICVG